MIVPQFWAEGRIQHKQDGRQLTVRRFGWSDTSQEDAQAIADIRTQEAMNEILAGIPLEKREPKVPYNGADGLPIREEIIARDGNVVVTRNSYGALCLNTPNVMFVDIDLHERKLRNGLLGSSPIHFIIYIIAGLALTTLGTLAAFIGVLIIFYAALKLVRLMFQTKRTEPVVQSSPREQMLEHIRAFATAHPSHSIRIYETPAGYRLLFVDNVFDPADPLVALYFNELQSDPMYVSMCIKQRCFRARVSPKPWRIGIPHVRPNPGVWPLKPHWIPLRKIWVTNYETKSAGYASCRFIEELGSGNVHHEANQVRQWHDELCKAHSGLPLA